MLITAFITMQWTATHIHLAEHHDHDGSHHLHSNKAHTHQLSGHHDDTIDSTHQTADLSVVELDHECNTVKWKKQKTPSITAVEAVFQKLVFFQITRTELPVILNTKQGFFDRSIVRSRAPPRFS